MKLIEVKNELKSRSKNEIEEKSVYCIAWQLMNNYNEQIEEMYEISDIESMFWIDNHFNVEKFIADDEGNSFYIDLIFFVEGDNCCAYVMGYDTKTYNKCNSSELNEDVPIQFFMIQNS